MKILYKKINYCEDCVYDRIQEDETIAKHALCTLLLPGPVGLLGDSIRLCNGVDINEKCPLPDDENSV